MKETYYIKNKELEKTTWDYKDQNLILRIYDTEYTIGNIHELYEVLMYYKNSFIPLFPKINAVYYVQNNKGGSTFPIQIGLPYWKKNMKGKYDFKFHINSMDHELHHHEDYILFPRKCGMKANIFRRNRLKSVYEAFEYMPWNGTREIIGNDQFIFGDRPTYTFKYITLEGEILQLKRDVFKNMPCSIKERKEYYYWEVII